MTDEKSTTGRRGLRLPKHYTEIVRAIRRAYNATDGEWPSSQKALFFNALHALSVLTSIPRTARPAARPSRSRDVEFFYKAIRALGETANECQPVKELLRLTDDYFRPERLGATVGNERYTSLGIHNGDQVHCVRADDLRDGELAALCGSKYYYVIVGRFRRAGQGYFLLEDDLGAKTYKLDSTFALYRVVKITQRERPKEQTKEDLSAEDLTAIRRRLDKLTDIADEGARFRLLRELYRRERRAEADEWPDWIPG
jgi:hypothetical protein